MKKSLTIEIDEKGSSHYYQEGLSVWEVLGILGFWHRKLEVGLICYKPEEKKDEPNAEV